MKTIRLLFFSLLLALSAFAQSEPATRTLYFVRHGACDYNDPDDKTGNPLLPLGRAQAALVGDRLASFPIKFSSVTSSEFTRARETGDIIAAKLGLNCARNGMLNECTPAATGYPSKPEQAGVDAQLTQAWQYYSTPAAGAPRHELLACHGNVIRWFVCRALGVDPRRWRQMEIANGSITIIEIRPGGVVRLLMFNDISHVPVTQQTWTGQGPAWPMPEQPKSK
ncbi:MAG TPA: phosphoglycerate mutase family protein [Lacunisphaera sp.]|jgi:serine/threonine-protein phosphatase PGAM5|nr:histidine phosphatase family protein [Lacunisphaera sp.]HQY04750.1 phosphoglycerate mutase family protein [Lacunisphaera sp.]